MRKYTPHAPFLPLEKCPSQSLLFKETEPHTLFELSLLDIGCIHLSANIFQLFCNYYNLDFFKLQPYFMFLNHQTMNKVITSYSLILVATCSPTHPSKQKVHLHSPLLLYLLRIPPQFFSSQLSVETDMFTRHLQYCKCLRVLHVLSISHSAFGNIILFCFGACECFVCISVGTPCECKSRGIRSPRTGVTRWVISLLQGQSCS